MFNKKDYNRDEAIRIFVDMYALLGEKNPYGVDHFTPVYKDVLKKNINEEINNHICKMADEACMFIKVENIIDESSKEEYIRYTLSMEPIVDNIINLDDYRGKK